MSETPKGEMLSESEAVEKIAPDRSAMLDFIISSCPSFVNLEDNPFFSFKASAPCLIFKLPPFLSGIPLYPLCFFHCVKSWRAVLDFLGSC